MGLMQTHEEMRWSVEMEIEGQHYFQKLFDKLRAEPDDTLLSALVNTEVPEWGRPLTDNELHAEMFADVFVGGSETTTNALAEGIVMLIENPDVWAKLKSDLIAYLEPFCEEVLRLESPVQGLSARPSTTSSLHGVTIPAGSVLNLRYAAGNRDERQFECPEEIDLDRKGLRRLAFGVGSHHCLGAPLARREMYYGFKALVDRVERLWFVEGANDFSHHQNFFPRALKEVHVGFEPVESWTKSGADRAADTRRPDAGSRGQGRGRHRRRRGHRPRDGDRDGAERRQGGRRRRQRDARARRSGWSRTRAVRRCSSPATSATRPRSSRWSRRRPSGSAGSTCCTTTRACTSRASRRS